MYYGLTLIRCVWRKQSEISVQVEGRSPRNEREPKRTSSWLIWTCACTFLSLPSSLSLLSSHQNEGSIGMGTVVKRSRAAGETGVLQDLRWGWEENGGGQGRGAGRPFRRCVPSTLLNPNPLGRHLATVGGQQRRDQC